jgi:hypothetical protein
MHMRRVFAMTLLLTLACSSGGSKGDGGPTGAGGGAGPSDSCQAARICALDCADATCLAVCAGRANAAAQVAFQALIECTMAMGQCASSNDINCLCAAQCLMDPPCIAEVDACVGGGADSVCDTTCH